MVRGLHPQRLPGRQEDLLLTRELNEAPGGQPQ